MEIVLGVGGESIKCEMTINSVHYNGVRHRFSGTHCLRRCIEISLTKETIGGVEKFHCISIDRKREHILLEINRIGITIKDTSSL